MNYSVFLISRVSQFDETILKKQNYKIFKLPFLAKTLTKIIYG
ncbi:hypothetical protein P5716_00970 [Mesomycoplasma ovipneumoniae]|uniref:Uncharacterized protein n=1 Tax=Mesomycoplasma ovipneumoniae TaxID=29562 RepID=A0AAW6Q8F3_9BACT|nr:hypothetical protein [Mesomycoplasma ovipneumoniae]MDF9627547.1 hypothetical protein [Mesomycoplasma ovipneumoniae]MDW2906820.1 hypothetical protein [Mesomycoplasma ovipneumoniae]